MHCCSQVWRTAVFAGLAVAFLAVGARAADTGNGSKNFRTPSNVPNYFSNEAGPVLGGAAESRRGELYMGQTYAIPRAPQTAAVVETPRPRQRVAMAEPRGRVIRTRGGRVVAHHVTVHGRQITRVVAHASARSHAVSRSAHNSAKSTRASSSRRRGRG